MTIEGFIARISYLSVRTITKCYHFTEAIVSGFWLGLMSEKSLDTYDELHYTRSKKYFDDSYNLSGLSGWEEEFIGKYFGGVKRILLIAAGGGRESLALARRGFDVESYECNTRLVEYGNGFLQRNGISSSITVLDAGTLPASVGKFDAIIIGWGAYSHFRYKNSRIEFLLSLHQLIKDNAPLVISFALVKNHDRKEKIVMKVSSFFRILTGRRKTEIGDRLFSYFIHFFTSAEITGELSSAGYSINAFGASDYGWLVAKKNISGS
jgi:2-polyprenyl-3-methyl-5-hydroxy-6-metoxy-1,4-benzoquinol methylase